MGPQIKIQESKPNCWHPEPETQIQLVQSGPPNPKTADQTQLLKYILNAKTCDATAVDHENGNHIQDAGSKFWETLPSPRILKSRSKTANPNSKSPITKIKLQESTNQILGSNSGGPNPQPFASCVKLCIVVLPWLCEALLL